MYLLHLQKDNNSSSHNDPPILPTAAPLLDIVPPILGLRPPPRNDPQVLATMALHTIISVVKDDMPLPEMDPDF